MICYRVGNLLESEAECLVNGVNCEGVMGKGIAFQFKEKFPDNYLHYVEACRTGECQIGKVFFCEDKGKLIANFPSKNRWRQPSQLSYISSGLISLVEGLQKRVIRSVAIPPIGCGNGGLSWPVVKEMIEKAFEESDITVYLYEPVKTSTSEELSYQKMTVDHLVLLRLADALEEGSLDMLHLEAAAFMMNIYRGKDYFRFDNNLLSSREIASLSRDIKAFKESHAVDNSGAESLLYNRLVSDKVKRTLKNLETPIRNAGEFVNTVKEDNRLKGAALLISIMKYGSGMTKEELVTSFIAESDRLKASLLSPDEAGDMIEILQDRGIITKDFFELSLAV